MGLAFAQGDDYASAQAKAGWAIEQAERVVELRREEAKSVFSNQVSEHEDVFRYSLMNLLWNRTFYRYDGCFDPVYCGKVDLHDVIIVPDKW